VAGAALFAFAAPIAGFIGIAAITSATIGAIGISLALSGVAEAFLGPKVPQSQLSRLNLSFDPTTPRKAVFGTTAMNADMRYQEASGTDQEYIDYIVAVAAHEVASIDEIWFEEKQAWTASGGVTSTYSGYLTVNVREVGTSANTISINGGSKWGSNCRLTGCAYIHLRVKRTGNSKEAESPLVSGLPSRITIIGDGALLYDPRLDTTVGGSGSHRADDQTTWGSYTAADDTDNPALQLLWWLLGWKINDKLSIGCGVPPARIDIPSFITAANICDESVTLATGGTQKRYRTSGTASDADDRMGVINTFLACMNGSLRDSNGKLSLTVIKNDLADYVLDFDENDILSEFSWNQTRGLSDSYNKARGRYVDPSTNALYQLVDYPEVGFDSPDGIERVMSLDLPYVEDGRRAQRIAKQVLQRNQYRGTFAATFTAKAQGCVVGDVVRVTFAALGWSNKLFRVVSQEIRVDGQVPMTLMEENAAIYAWDAEDAAPVSPTAPTVYDPLKNPFILATAQPSLDGIAPITLYADYLGAFLTDQLPFYFNVVRRKGGDNVSDSTTWSVISQDGITGGTVTIDSTGYVTIPSGISMGSNASVVIRSVRDGITLETTAGITKLNAQAPTTGGSGGGTTVSDSSFTSVTTTSFVDISDVMTVNTGSAGQIQFSAPLTVTATKASPEIDGPESNVEMKWQYRTSGGGSYADVASAVNSDPDVEIYYDVDSGLYLRNNGAITCSPLLTGLSSSTAYDVKLVARRTSSTVSKAISFTGTASAVGS
jgi:hypothetical protein